MLTLLLAPAVSAADNSDGFNIQVSPSPLVVTLTPRQRQTAAITVRNLSSHSETLRPQLNGFTVGDAGEKIDLQNSLPLGLDQWISFKQQMLTIAPGGSQLLEVMYNTPSNVGFSYSLAITLNQVTNNQNTRGATLRGSVAVFNLININRPDAKRELQITGFKSNKSRYQYLPASFSLTIKNNGNVIDQPRGNLFIQRKFDDAKPIATIPINNTSSYVLPATSRTLPAEWDKGFPRYTTDNAGGISATKLTWNWGDISSLRLGKYVAKVVVIYNDGQRDVPLLASTTFWVIPWTLILGVVVVVGLVATGLVAWVRLAVKGTKKVRKYAHRK